MWRGRLAAAALALATPAAGAAQVAPNRAAFYLFPTDARDARALWVNPAGLAVIPQASVNLDLTVGNPGSAGRLRQLSAGFNSRGLSFGYQRDVFDGGVHGNTFRIGIAGSAASIAAGAAVSVYRGDTRGTGWDIGLVYDGLPLLTVGATLANIEQPVVRGVLLPATFTPAVTFTPFGARVAVSAEGRITTDSVAGYAFGVRWSSGGATTRWPLGLLARLDTDRTLQRTAFAFGVSIGSRDLLGAVVTTPGDVSRVDAASLYGVSSRSGSH